MWAFNRKSPLEIFYDFDQDVSILIVLNYDFDLEFDDFHNFHISLHFTMHPRKN